MTDATPAVTKTLHPRGVLLVLVVVVTSVGLAVNSFVVSRLTEGSTADLGVLQLRLAFNPGIAFSLGDRLPSWAILAVAGFITLALAGYAVHVAPDAGVAGRIGFAAVLGGALTNLIDRAADGVVTDYFHTGWFPTFNLADTFITIGVVLIVLDVLRQEWSAPRDA